MIKAQRDHTLDTFKGLLVVLMTWGHVMQFFGDHQLFPILDSLETTINLLVFPGFVFAFGAAAEMAYFRKPFRRALPRMLVAAGKALGAFYLSGFAFRVVREGKPFAAGIWLRILLLQDLPGWSEFLASFAALAVLTMLLHPLAKQLRARPLWLLFLGIGCLFLCCIPYAHVMHPVARLYLGTDAFPSFPVLQFLPYYLAGLYYARREKREWMLPLVALLMTGGGAIRTLWLGHLPMRFPPDVGWVLLPAAGVAVLFGVAWLLSRLHLGRLSGLQPARLLRSLGANSLFYLLVGNLTLFTMAGKGIAPQLQFKSPGLFGQPIMAPWGSFVWTVCLLLAAAFVAGLVRRVGRE